MGGVGESPSAAAPIVLLALASLLFALVRVPFVSVPLERDEGEYAYIAQRALAGDVPYRDAFDQKPPGVFAAYLTAFAVFGASIEGIHLFMYAWTALTAVALFGLLRRLADDLAAAFAVLLFALISIEPRLAATAANTEIFMLLPLVASVWCLLVALERDRAGWWLGCGALAAAACWFKPVAAPGALFVSAFAAGDTLVRGRGLAGVARAGVWLAAGALAVSAPVFALFAVLDAWQPFLDAVFLHNLAYTARVPLAAGVRNALHELARQAPSLGVAWALAAVGGLAAFRAGPRTGLFLLGFAAASAAGVASGLYFRAHYFVQWLPALAALAGVGAAALARPLLARASPPLAWLGLAALALALVAPPLLANRALLGASPDEISRRVYGLNPFVESPKLAAYIRRTSDPDDRVYVIGSEPQILFYADRRSATRYIFFYPLTGPFPDALERQQEVVREVAAARPLYVVWANIPASMLVLRNSERHVFEAARELLDRDYRLELVARPPVGGVEGEGVAFQFVYGSRARELLAEAQSRAEPTPWIAVFRRAS